MPQNLRLQFFFSQLEKARTYSRIDGLLRLSQATGLSTADCSVVVVNVEASQICARAVEIDAFKIGNGGRRRHNIYPIDPFLNCINLKDIWGQYYKTFSGIIYTL